jgi:hypothetical protein
VTVVAGFCLSRLKTLEVSETARDADGIVDLSNMDVAATYAKALCNWGRGDDLLDCITTWFRKGKRVAIYNTELRLSSVYLAYSCASQQVYQLEL